MTWIMETVGSCVALRASVVLLFISFPVGSASKSSGLWDVFSFAKKARGEGKAKKGPPASLFWIPFSVRLTV